MTIQLSKVIYKKINANFAIEGEKTLNIQSKISLHTNYLNDNNECIASMSVESTSVESPDYINIAVELVGVFKCSDINSKEDKQLAHVQISQYLFPYIQSTISDLYVKAGLPPLIIEAPVIDFKNIPIND